MNITHPIRVAHHLFGIDLESINIFKKNSLTILSLNVRSIINKLSLFEYFLGQIEIEPDIICLNETWLKQTNVELMKLEGYEEYHLIRANRSGGGTSIFVKSTISHNSKPILNKNKNDIEFLMINITKLKINVCATYRQPVTSNYDIFYEELNNILNN